MTVKVPGLLARFTGGTNETVLDAATLGACLDRLVERYPALEPHLLDGNGALRDHLLVVHDGTMIDWPADATTEVETGDEISIVQAVSGG